MSGGSVVVGGIGGDDVDDVFVDIVFDVEVRL